MIRFRRTPTLGRSRCFKKLAKQDRIENGLIIGGLTFAAFAVHELARQFVFSKAQESSPLYALGEHLGELGAVAQGDDGTEWAYVAGRGWHQINEAGGVQVCLTGSIEV